MKPIAIIVNMKSIELVTCISGGITLIQFCAFSDYAVGVLAYQKMIYIFSHYACVLLLS